jgi:hypothetical protein
VTGHQRQATRVGSPPLGEFGARVFPFAAGPVDEQGVAAVGIVVFGGERHRPHRVELRFAPAVVLLAGGAAEVAGQSGGARLQGHVGNLRRIPTDVEEALGVDRLLLAVAVDVLCDGEGDVGDVDDRLPFRVPLRVAAQEWAEELAQVELLHLEPVDLRQGGMLELAQHLGRLPPQRRHGRDREGGGGEPLGPGPGAERLRPHDRRDAVRRFRAKLHLDPLDQPWVELQQRAGVRPRFAWPFDLLQAVDQVCEDGPHRFADQPAAQPQDPVDVPARHPNAETAAGVGADSPDLLALDAQRPQPPVGAVKREVGEEGEIDVFDVDRRVGHPQLLPRHGVPLHHPTADPAVEEQLRFEVGLEEIVELEGRLLDQILDGEAGLLG